MRANRSSTSGASGSRPFRLRLRLGFRHRLRIGLGHRSRARGPTSGSASGSGSISGSGSTTSAAGASASGSGSSSPTPTDVAGGGPSPRTRRSAATSATSPTSSDVVSRERCADSTRAITSVRATASASWEVGRVTRVGPDRLDAGRRGRRAPRGVWASGLADPGRGHHGPVDPGLTGLGHARRRPRSDSAEAARLGLGGGQQVTRGVDRALRQVLADAGVVGVGLGVDPGGDHVGLGGAVGQHRLGGGAQPVRDLGVGGPPRPSARPPPLGGCRPAPRVSLAPRCGLASTLGLGAHRRRPRPRRDLVAVGVGLGSRAASASASADRRTLLGGFAHGAGYVVLGALVRMSVAAWRAASSTLAVSSPSSLGEAVPR